MTTPDWSAEQIHYADQFHSNANEALDSFLTCARGCLKLRGDTDTAIQLTLIARDIEAAELETRFLGYVLAAAMHRIIQTEKTSS